MTKVKLTRYFGLVLGFGLASAAYGQTPLELISGSDSVNDGAYACGNSSTGCFYTSPYGMSLNGRSVDLICDDFQDEISAGESWYVTATPLSQITGGAGGVGDNTSVYFGDVNGYTQQELYVAAAYLAVQIDDVDGAGSIQQIDDSVALWELFDPSGVANAQVTTSSAGAVNAAASYQAALDYALHGSPTATSGGVAVTGSTFENGEYTVTIYTPETNGSPDPTSNTARPQEFIGVTYVPEPSTWAFLGFDFAGAGIVGLYFLRRKSVTRS